MMAISRRRFIQSAATVTVANLLPRQLHSLSTAGSTRRLVMVHLRGGCDGLNLVVPHFDPNYYALRPTISIPRERVIDLDGRFGIHPALAALKPLWDNKSLAVFHAVGSPTRISGHVEAEAFVEHCILPCAEAGVAVETVELEGWDTHCSQGACSGRFSERARDFAEVLAGLWRRFENEQSYTMLIAVSEFGRSVAGNARGGTDHGHAGVVFLLGSPIKGGRVYGDWPGLLNPYFQPTTDLRSIFAQILKSPGILKPTSPALV
jgi:uncharacterized protein (DUF1501 family)